MLAGRFGLNLLFEFSHVDSARIVTVKLLQHWVGLLLRHVEATRLNDALDLASVDPSVGVEVERVERRVGVEVRVAVEALADGLSSDFELEVLAPHVTELDLSVGEEAIVAAVERVSVVRWATVQHVRVVRVAREESICELLEAQAVVTILVVALEEQVHLVNSGEDANSSEAVTNLALRDGASAGLVENGEGVVKVEVRLEGQWGLGWFQLALKADEVSESVHKLVLFRALKRRLAGGADADRRATDWRAANRWCRAAYWWAADRRAADRGAADRWAANHRGRAVSDRWATDRWAAYRGAPDRGATNGARSRPAGAANTNGRSAAGWWGLRSDKVSKLAIGELAVTVGVDAADDLNELRVKSVYALALEEGRKVTVRDEARVVTVDRAEGLVHGVIAPVLKVALHAFELTLESQLLLDDLDYSALDLTRQRVKAADSHRGSVQGHRPKTVILARQEHLQEAKV
jgi:hypothetical protein